MFLGGGFGGSLALFFENDFVGITDTLTFVRFWLSDRSDISGHLTDKLFVDTGDFDFILTFRSDGNARNFIEDDGVRVTNGK